jgi:hypothetical protein
LSELKNISTMMKAAQLAAEAAMAEAAREENASRHSQLHGAHDSDMDLQYSDEDVGMNPEQIAFLRAMQAAEMGDQASMLRDLGMMGMGNNANDSVQSLLQMLAQQDQELRRPEEHYLTIAQNGKLCYTVYTTTVASRLTKSPRLDRYDPGSNTNCYRLPTRCLINDIGVSASGVCLRRARK